MSSYDPSSSVGVSVGGVWSAMGAYFGPSVASMGSDISSYVTTSVGVLAAQSTDALKAATSSSRRRSVLFKAFAESPSGGSAGKPRRRLILLGLTDGFQVIEVTSTRHTRVIAAYSDAPASTPGSYSVEEPAAMLNQAAAVSTPIGCVRLLTHPHHTPAPPPASPSLPYYGALLAVCSSEDRANFPRSVLKVFSLALGRFVHMIRFRTRIFGVHTHADARHLVVALENELHVYTLPTDGFSLNFECIWSTRILPNPSPHILAAMQATVASQPGASANTASMLATSTLSKDEWSVAAVSQRWVAYCLHAPLQADQQPAAIFSADATIEQPNTLPASGSNESLSTVAKGIASGLYNLGGMGKLAVANYLSGDATTSEPTPPARHAAAHQQTAPSVLGTVLVRDILTQRIIACIRAHPNTQITHLAFDRSGTLLATVPVDGQYIHIYQIVMVPEPVSAATQQAGTSAAPNAAAADNLQSSRRSSLSHSHSPLLHAHAAPTSNGSPSPPQPQYHTRFLYRLFRGITHAVVRDIAFSFDGKYVSVVSAKGTAHLYAINPIIGGDVSSHTHGPTEAVDDNSLTQQMVAKYAVLRQQQENATESESDAVAQSALDSFLYQPKILSAIYRIKPSGVATSFANGPQFAAPMYLPVIATFDRLDQAATPHSAAATAATPPHHLIMSTWNDEINTFSVSAAAHPPAHSDALDHDRRPKMTLLVDPLGTMDLHATLINNAGSTASQSTTPTSYSASRRGSHPQPHQQQTIDQGFDQEPTVRILTMRGQEDEPAPMQPQTISPMLRPVTGAATFFQLDADPMYGRSHPGALIDSPAAASAPIAIPARSLLQTNSPIFSTLAASTASLNGASRSTSTDSSPLLGATAAQDAQQAQGSRWLSEVELRTYQTSDVPLWASPQFALKTYDDGSAAAPWSLYVEQAGSSPIAYDKFAQFAGLRTNPPPPAANNNTIPKSASATSLNGVDVEDAISAALSSSMLDDAGFIASLRATTPPSANANLRSGEVEFDPDEDVDGMPNGRAGANRLEDDEGQTSLVFGMAGGGGGVASGQLMSGIDEEYYPACGGRAIPEVNLPDGRASSSTTTDSATPGDSAPTRASPLQMSSALFPSHASASEILFAPLRPANEFDEPTDSILLSPTNVTSRSTNSSASPASVTMEDEPLAATTAKGKKKKKNKLKSRESDE